MQQESWSWAGCEGKKAYVEVYARAAKIALFLNGRLHRQQKELKEPVRRNVYGGVHDRAGWRRQPMMPAGREIARSALETADAVRRVLRAVPERKNSAAGRAVLYPAAVY